MARINPSTNKPQSQSSIYIFPMPVGDFYLCSVIWSHSSSPKYAQLCWKCIIQYYNTLKGIQHFSSAFIQNKDNDETDYLFPTDTANIFLGLDMLTFSSWRSFPFVKPESSAIVKLNNISQNKDFTSDMLETKELTCIEKQQCFHT